MRHQLGLAIFNDKNKTIERIRGGHAVQSYSRRTCASRWLVDSQSCSCCNRKHSAKNHLADCRRRQTVRLTAVFEDWHRNEHVYKTYPHLTPSTWQLGEPPVQLASSWLMKNTTKCTREKVKGHNICYNQLPFSEPPDHGIAHFGATQSPEKCVVPLVFLKTARRPLFQLPGQCVEQIKQESISEKRDACNH